MAATNLSPNLETEDPEGSWVERSSVLINRAFAHGVQLREIFFNFVRYLYHSKILREIFINVGSKIISARYIME